MVRFAIPLFVMCAVAACLVALAVSLGDGQETVEADDPGVAAGRRLPANVVLAVESESHIEQRRYTGLVKARRSVDLSFTRSARLERLLVDHGDVVAKGDPLAELDTQHLELQKAKLTSALAEARAVVAKLTADPRLQDPIALRQSLQQLRSEFEQLKARMAESNTAESPVSERMQSLQRNLETIDAATRTQIEEQQQVVADLQGQLAEVDAQLEESTLRAPFDGVIALLHVEPASLVAPSRPVLRIVDQSELVGWVAIPAAAAPDVVAGRRFALTVDGRTYPAEVSTVLPEVDLSTRSRTMILKFDETSSAKLSPGMVFQLSLPREVPGTGFWLPLTALTRQTRGLWSVLVVTEDEMGVDRVSRRYVEVMHLDGERAWVRGMLGYGERVVADGTHRLVEGQTVKALLPAGGDPVDVTQLEERTP